MAACKEKSAVNPVLDCEAAIQRITPMQLKIAIQSASADLEESLERIERAASIKRSDLEMRVSV